MIKVNKVRFLIIVEDFIFTTIYFLISQKAGHCLHLGSCQQQLNVIEYFFNKYYFIIIIFITIKLGDKLDKWYY